MDSTKTSFKDIFTEGLHESLLDLSDGKLQTEDGCTFDVHRVILARENRYFRAMFCGMGKSRREFLIPGIRGEILDLILLYIYTGSIHLTQANICELLVASDYVLADNLMLQIKKFTEDSISLDNCIPIYTTALKVNHEDILRASYRFIQTHFEAVFENCAAEFGEISFESIKQFLNDKNACVTGEHVVWFALEKWVQEDSVHRLHLVPDLLECLKAEEIDEFLATEIIHSDIIAKNPFCKELNEMMLPEQPKNNLGVLTEYFSGKSPSSICNHRGPECMHLIARYHVHNLTDGIQIYITYDENVDLWRQLGEIDFCPTFLIAMGNFLYMFDAYNNRNITFNIYEKRWSEIRGPRIPRVSYRLVNLQDAIYILGGESVLTGEELLDVEFYNPDIDLWFDASSMLPVTSFASVAFRDNIFVVGKMPEILGLGMVAQVYDTESNTWSLFTPPDLYRFDFAFIAYHKKLYIIGGSNGSKLLKKVEVFDTGRHRWEKAEDLPYSYYLPKAVVLNDHLIVFDSLLEDPKYLKKNPPVSWNDVDESWENLDKSLPLKDLALYLFCLIDDKERISKFLKENRDPKTQFQKSPFN